MSVFEVLLFGALAGLCVGIYAGVGCGRWLGALQARCALRREVA